MLLVGLLITVLVALYVKTDVESIAQREFDDNLSEAQVYITERMADNALILHAGAALFDASQSVSRAEWQSFARRMQVDRFLPGTQGIGYSVIIRPAELESFVQQIRAQGLAQYQVWPSGEREVYSSILYLEPFSGRNLRALGYDMYSDAVRRAAMDQARDENAAVLSGRVTLVQETDQDIQPGTLMYVPVYQAGMPIMTVEERRAAIRGWVYSPYRMTDLMRGTLRDWEARQADHHTILQVYDGERISAGSLLYDSRGEAFEDVSDSAGNYTVTAPLDLAGRRWTLRIIQLGGIPSLAHYQRVRLVAFAGTSISILLFGLALSLLNTRVNARRMAERLTLDLRESEEKFHQFFEQSSDGMALVDEEARVIEWNPALEQLTGLPRSQVIHMPLLELQTLLTPGPVAPEARERQAELLTMALREGKSPFNNNSLEASYRKADGTLAYAQQVAFPIKTRSGYRLGLFSRDISDRKRVEDALRYDHWRMESIIYGTNIGTWEWNVQTGEVVINERWAEIVGYGLAELAPITILTWEKLCHPEDFKRSNQLIEQHFAGQLAEYDIECRMRHKDGRWVWVHDRGRLVTRTPDGQPLMMFGTHADITERKQIEAAEYEQRTQLIVEIIEREHAEERLDQQNQVLSALYENMLDVLQIHKLDDLLQVFAVRAAELVGASYCEIMLLEGEELVVRAATPNLEFLVGERVRQEDALLSWRTLKAGQPFVVDDYAGWPERRAVYDRMPAHALVSYPILKGERCIGVFDISRSQPDEPFTPEQVQVGSLFVRLATLAIENSRLYEEARESSVTDVLTGMLNRRGLLQFGSHEVERAFRFERPLSLIMFDVDHFKRVNDTYGHPLGDRILSVVAETCRGLLRTVDIAARYGGDEFILILPETGLESAVQVAERVRASIEKIVFVYAPPDSRSAPSVQVTVSLGVVALSPTALDLEKIIALADQALYEAKQSGRNRVVQKS